MILRGERNREEKLKDIAEYKERKIKDDIEEAKRFHVLFVCQQCGLRISFEPKREGFSFSYMSYDFDDYREFFQEEPDYIPLEHNYKNIKSRYWGGPSSYICLDCGSGLFNEKMDLKVCEQCGSRSIVAGNDLCGKPCPVCGTEFGKAIELQGLKTYWTKVGVLKDEWWDIYREKYHVKKPIPPNYTKEEIDEQERRVTLMENYRDNSYALDSSHNVLRFEFDDAFFSGTFFCIIEWDDDVDGKLTLFKWFGDIWVEKNIEYENIKQIIKLLFDYDYFNKTFFEDNHGLDGHTIGLEVKYKQKYKELAIWGIEDGILYDIGMLLIQFAGKTFKELYEYAW